MIRDFSVAAVLYVTAPLHAAMACETLLTVTGADGEQTYDRDELMAMEATEFTTTTPWTDGPQTFRGVPLADLLADAGIEEGTVRATALNEYAGSLDVADVQQDAAGNGPVIAYLMNGAEMSVRDKGPLWLVWPYNAPGYSTESIFSSSVWQLESIRQMPPQD
ncbi:molybdopterin-dependent oxidoreductase [Paracoccus tibetensis]|uniref:Oxidoreductase molybdopterin-binding domain-containing protein n=1 Tax=Paracoccus tibetensis TaxID=336292 RepID=A0A1G5HZX4_9RHOB|nr:molybdopterin-dependent oxidoreductase [Paracoccus tibetensis]SCY68608.1 hypothetical protein SAMN05660710_02376 [Paracoccus tibetensis]